MDRPGSAATALGVAGTNVPSAVLPLMEVTAPAGITGLYQAVWQDWSAPLTGVIEAPLVYGGDVDPAIALVDATDWIVAE